MADRYRPKIDDGAYCRGCPNDNTLGDDVSDVALAEANDEQMDPFTRNDFDSSSDIFSTRNITGLAFSFALITIFIVLCIYFCIGYCRKSRKQTKRDGIIKTETDQEEVGGQKEEEKMGIMDDIDNDDQKEII